MNGEAAGPEFSSLQAAFDAYGMTEVHEPTWLPDGYVLGELDVTYLDDPFQQTFAVSYTDNEGYVSINVMSYEDEPATQVQKTGDPVESVVKDGITFYLIQNTDNCAIAWYTDQYEYYLSSKNGKDILWQVVESMFS